MTAAKFAEIVGKAARDEHLSGEIAQKIIDGFPWNSVSDRVDFPNIAEIIEYLVHCGQQCVCSNYQALYLVSRIKEADSGSNPQ